MLGFSACILDSPSTTSAVTYKIQVFQTQNSSDSSKTVCINRAGRDADDSAGHDGNASSTAFYSYTNGDILMFAMDNDNRKLWFVNN